MNEREHQRQAGQKKKHSRWVFFLQCDHRDPVSGVVSKLSLKGLRKQWETKQS